MTKWESARAYKMTVSTFIKTRYEFIEYEIHYKAKRKGKIKNVRKHLVKRGVKHFQQNVYRLTKIWIPLERVRISFEREISVSKEDNKIEAEAKKVVWENKKSKVYSMPVEPLSYRAKRSI